MPKNLYKLPPNQELLLKSVRALGFDDLRDIRWIDESHCNKTLMEEVRNSLRHYLLPCMSKVYLDREQTYRTYLTLVRQLLATQNRKLLCREKCLTVSKGCYKYVPTYSLSPETTPLTQPVTVFFTLPDATALVE